MELLEQEIDSADLHVGMYVCRLDRDWNGTPFPLQGVLIRTREDIDEIGRYARRVWVDLEKSTGPAVFHLHALAPKARVKTKTKIGAESELGTQATLFDDEILISARLLDQLSERTTDFLGKLRRGELVSQAEIDEVVEPVVRSLIRNPDAYFWLESLRSRHHYTYTHAVNCCALAAAFGRHLGFDDKEVKALATGALLLDIGMGAVPPDMINHEGPLDDVGRAFVERHVSEGVERLRQSGLDDPAIIDMVLNHHEHFDGSGYPEQKMDGSIPLPGRIAGLVDAYDAMTSERPYRPALSRAEALQQLVKQRNGQRDADLVEQFVRCLGVYPVGTLVELNTGEVGLVMSQNPSQRLRPRVMMLTNPTKQLRAHFIPVNLMDTEAQPALAKVHIARSLPPGSYGLDPAALDL
ncbi:HD-GYP domain-containing protein [Solilutibacter tolerans]|uniref:HD-GYP domain, c-di-GMP phosphodiesterase class II (Or its inactivated variant) n=1 Tax=Solilutibacter tolerans TaxID=1604334 RepID=A0A1N6TC23_9GAMM|nr:HD-GYP domain-containing protein [Lysobacter tolerans]SIQ50656.1 HD-GYP domain, c-di-GMP phosphodiesterase class II (or its inactivated variant) [Lysobacter tolerans]